jgi:hypothetical protein
MRAHYALHGLDSYAKVVDDLERTVPSPEKKKAGVRVKEAQRRLAEIDADLDRPLCEELAEARGEAVAYLDSLGQDARATPARVPLDELHADTKLLDHERKRIHDAIRMATYNAESSLARMLSPHYARADDEARTFLREVLSSPADLVVVNDQLHVLINALCAPRRNRALAALCVELTDTETTYPGTDLTLVYSVKGF